MSETRRLILQYLDCGSLMQLTSTSRAMRSMERTFWDEWLFRQSVYYFGTGPVREFWQQRAVEYFGSQKALTYLKGLALSRNLSRKINVKPSFIPDKLCAPLYLATLYRLAGCKAINLHKLTCFTPIDGKNVPFRYVTDLTGGYTAITTCRHSEFSTGDDTEICRYQQKKEKWELKRVTIIDNKVKVTAGLNCAYEKEASNNGIRQLALAYERGLIEIRRQSCTAKNEWISLPDITLLTGIRALLWLSRSRLLVGTAAGHIHVIALKLGEFKYEWVRERVLRGNNKDAAVSDLALMPGEQLACAHIEGTVRIWSFQDNNWQQVSSFKRKTLLITDGLTEAIHFRHVERNLELLSICVLPPNQLALLLRNGSVEIFTHNITEGKWNHRQTWDGQNPQRCTCNPDLFDDFDFVPNEKDYCDHCQKVIAAAPALCVLPSGQLLHVVHNDVTLYETDRDGKRRLLKTLTPKLKKTDQAPGRIRVTVLSNGQVVAVKNKDENYHDSVIFYELYHSPGDQ